MILQSNEIISQYNDLPLLKAYHSRRAPFKRDHIKHCHSAFEISLIRSGEGLYQVGDCSYSFCEGDVFLFSTNEIHCITEVFPGKDLHIINVQFEPRFIWSPGNDVFDLRYLDVFFHRSQQFCHQLMHNDPRSCDIRNLLEIIDAEFRDKKGCYEMMVKNLLLTALVHIRRNYDEYFIDNPQPHNLRLIPQLNEVMKYIDEHLFEELSIELLSEKAHMSRSHFSALFCELNGISAWEYIIDKRVTHAAYLLQSTEETVIEVASSCGFNTIANFNYAFKKHTNKTPTQYRKEAVR
jgi:AraC-like DNA-binding protein